MDYYSGYITKLIEELSTLPGVGAKTAGRLAFHILDMPKEQVEDIARHVVPLLTRMNALFAVVRKETIRLLW